MRPRLAVRQAAGAALRLAAVLVTTAWLAGCMIVSDAELVADAEAVPLLPDPAYLTPYEEDGPDAWTVGDDPAMRMDRQGNTYISGDPETRVRLAPLAGRPGHYLFAMGANDGWVYGVAEQAGDILVINVILGDADPAAIVRGSGVAALAALPSSSEGDTSIEIATREQLDAAIDLHLAGKLSLLGLVLFVAPSPDAAVPGRIVRQDGTYRAE